MSGTQNRVNPIIAIAAVSVIIFSAVGIGVMAGVIPSSFSKGADPAGPMPTAAQGDPQRPQANAKSSVKDTGTTQASPTRVAAAEVPKPAPQVCADCGKVTTVQMVQQEGEGTGLGAVAGGVVGGVLGNQIGRGTGRKIATVAGAAGGAYVGHQAEKSMKSTKRWDVAVRMESGDTRMFSFDHEPMVRVGDYVKVRDGQLVLN
jgi:outer membrane lipoprotein SlyB